MALDQIDLGSAPNAGDGDDLRAAFAKVNLIITQMWDTVTGGIAYLLGSVGIGTATPSDQLHNHIATGNIFTRTESGGANSSGYRFINSINSWLFYVEGSAGKAQLSDATGSGIPFIVEPGAPTNSIYIDSTGNVGINKANANSKFAVSGLPVYANNAAALVGGLTAGDFYKTASTGDATVMVTNAT